MKQHIVSNKGIHATWNGIEIFSVIRDGMKIRTTQAQISDLAAVSCGKGCPGTSKCPGIHELQVVVKVEEV